MFSVWSEVFFTWVFNSAGMVCSLNSCSAFRIDPKARCQLPVLDLPDLPVSRVLLCLLLPSVPIPAAVLGSLLLLSGVSGCVVGAPQKWRDKPLPAPEPAPAPHKEAERRLPLRSIATPPELPPLPHSHDVCGKWALRSGQDRRAALGPGGQSGR